MRKAANALKTAEKRRIREGTLGFWEMKDQEKVAQTGYFAYDRRRREIERNERLRFLKSGLPPDSHDSQEDGNDGILQQETRDPRARRRRTVIAKGVLADAPLAVPYTQSNSEFLFGTFAVLAALRSNKRKIHKLYMWCGEDGYLVDNDEQTTEIVRLAGEKKVPLLRVAGSWEKMLDRMSDRRPHNGLILEASPLPQMPTKVLHPVASPDDVLTISLNHMDQDAKADLYLSSDAKTYNIPRAGTKEKYPFLLWLDRVTDTGNMGAILRTAYFFGVDAIIVPQHGTAPLNGVVVKTSAGAAEHIPILEIANETDFIRRSKENGWRFYAAAAETSTSTLKTNGKAQTGEAESSSDPLKSAPCVLMLGNEGTGLRAFLQKEATDLVSITSPRAMDKHIDSLNVSVAAALLTQRFLGS